MVAFGDITTWTPGAGQVTTWTASPASRALMRSAPLDPLAPSHQQAQHLRNAHRCAELGVDMPRLLITAWDIPGICDMTAMTATINDHLRCQDTYHSAFEIVPDGILRRTIADPTDIEFIATAAGLMDNEQTRRHVLTTTPVTQEWDCFTFGVIQHAGHFTFYASVDHLHFDGMSAGPLFSDIHHGYQARVHGLPDPVLHDTNYRAHTAEQHDRCSVLTLQSPQVQAWIDVAGDDLWPAFPLSTGAATGVGPGIFITEDLLDAAQTEAFSAACRAVGARFSGGVMACAALADHDFTGNDRFRTFTPSDTRSAGDSGHSIGWFASLFPVTVPIGEGRFGDVAPAAQASFDGNRHLAHTPMARALEIACAAGVDIALPSTPPMMVSFMDLRSPTMAVLLEGDNPGMFGDPLSGGGVNVWVNRYRSGTTVTISLPDNTTARRSAHRYIAALRAAFNAAIAGHALTADGR